MSPPFCMVASWEQGARVLQQFAGIGWNLVVCSPPIKTEGYERSILPLSLSVRAEIMMVDIIKKKKETGINMESCN